MSTAAGPRRPGRCVGRAAILGYLALLNFLPAACIARAFPARAAVWPARRRSA